MGLPEASLALPWDAPVHRSGRLEWDLGGMRFTMPSTFPPKSSCALHTWAVTNHRLQCRFSLADMSTAPGACCPKSLSNASRSHADALTSSMTGHIIVPLCARIDVFGFRIMCSGPVDDAPRRLLVGRTSSCDDVQGAASAAVADEGASDVTVFMTLHSAHVTCSAHAMMRRTMVYRMSWNQCTSVARGCLSWY